MNTCENTRFAAKVLFQFRTEKNGVSNKRRVCEERIIIIYAANPNEAVDIAKKRGKSEEFSYFDKGFEIFFEFIGITELIELISLEDDEVWWQLSEKVMPMEKRDKLIPEEHQLDALLIKAPKKRGKLSVPGKGGRANNKLE
jgi:hypothetical protein